MVISGCAIYTGQETKMALNSNTKVTKFSRVERYCYVFFFKIFFEKIKREVNKHD